MPARKSDAHRALELLEEYHSRLIEPNDKPLRTAIEKIIRIFRSRLFQALVEIQEFYDTTLMDEMKALPSKTREALEMAARWEKQSPMPGGDRRSSRALSQSSNERSAPQSPAAVAPTVANGDKGELPPERPPPPQDEESLPPPPEEVASVKLQQQTESKPEPSKELTQPVDDIEMEVVLMKVPGRGLGFSIAGGIDNQHIQGDNRVYITKVIPGGIAEEDGRLRPNDRVLQVNDTVLENTSHADAVAALREAKEVVAIRISRKRSEDMTDVPDVAPPVPAPEPVTPERPSEPKPNIMRISLVKKDRGLGFSIAGGIGNHHVPGDNSIFITKIIPGGVAEMEGTLVGGDKLLQVDDTVLENVTHTEAVQALQRASGTTILVIERQPTESPRRSPQPAQPDMGVSPSTDYPRNSRRVTLQKGSSGLGFNIVGGEGGEGIYISFLLAGGVADLSGQLRKGDQILEVNGKNLAMASHEEAAQVLKGSGTTVSMLVAYRPEDYSRFEERINRMRETVTTGGAAVPHSPSGKQVMQFCRALFDYEHTLDAGQPGTGLSFHHGDVLHILNMDNNDWWQARLVNMDSNEDEGPLGYIPSKKRIEKKQRANKKKSPRSASIVEDRPPHEVTGGSLKRKRSFTFSKKLPFFKKADKDKKKGDEGEEPVLSYEEVTLEEVMYKRPIVILGPNKDQVNDHLIQEFPDKFGSCVPHTTRARRDYEVDGRDYHFVESRAQMEQDIQNHLFIEAGQYNDNLYGTSVAAVQEVAVTEQKHCVLDVSGYAIRRLQVAGLHPIAILLKPSSPEVIRDQNRRITEEQARKTYERAMKLCDEFGEYFTAVLTAEMRNDMYAQVERVIRQHSGPRIWVTRRSS